MATQGINELETLIDTIFIRAEGQNRISVHQFKVYIVDELKVKLQDKDLDMFVMSQPQLARDDFISKQQILNVFDEPFRMARLKVLEGSSRFGQQLSEAETVFGYP